MYKVFYTTEAELDLKNIFSFSFEKFGYEQAVKYILELRASINQIIKSFPESCQSRPEINENVKVCNLTESHRALFAVVGFKIVIFRIIHHKEDLKKYRNLK